MNYLRCDRILTYSENNLLSIHLSACRFYISNANAGMIN